MSKILKIWPIILIGLIAWLCEDIWVKNLSTIVSLSNSIEAKDVKIGSKVGGRISKIYISEGDFVKEGQILLTLDGNDIIPQLEQSKANLLKVEMELNDVLAGSRKQEIEETIFERKYSEEILEQSKAKLINISADYQRIYELYKSGATSKQSFDKYQLDKNLAEIDVKSKEKLLIISKQKESLAKEGYRSNHIRSKIAEVAVAKAKYLEFKNLVGELTLIAPISGEISSFDLKVGEVVQPNEVLATITDLSDIFVRIYVNSSILGMIMINDPVDVIADAYPTKIFLGKIKYISAQAEFTPRNVQTSEERSKLVYPVKVVIDNQDKKLRDGMYVVVKIKN